MTTPPRLAEGAAPTTTLRPCDYAGHVPDSPLPDADRPVTAAELGQLARRVRVLERVITAFAAKFDEGIIRIDEALRAHEDGQ